MTEKYFVVSDDSFPQSLQFDKEEAFALKYEYVDSFDENGKLVESYKFDEETEQYTTIF